MGVDERRTADWSRTSLSPGNGMQRRAEAIGYGCHGSDATGPLGSPLGYSMDGPQNYGRWRQRDLREAKE